MKNTIINTIINAIDTNNEELLNEIEINFALSIYGWNDCKYINVLRASKEDAVGHLCFMHMFDILAMGEEGERRAYAARWDFPEDHDDQREIALLLMQR